MGLRHKRGTASERAKEQIVMRHRFQVPIAKLSLHVANFAVFSLPLVVHESIGVVLGPRVASQWTACVGYHREYTHYSMMWNTMIRCSVQLRIAVDVLIGLGTGAELGGCLSSLLPPMRLTRRAGPAGGGGISASQGTGSTNCLK